MRSIVVAYDKNRGIGSNGRPLWKSGELPSDTRHFRSLTAGSSVVMGRTSYETFHGLLPGRQNIVITRRERLSRGVTMVKSLDEAYQAAELDDVNIIGGESIFKLAIDTVDWIYATEVDFEFIDSNSFFPQLDKMLWQEVKREDHAAGGADLYSYSFVVYKRINNSH